MASLSGSVKDPSKMSDPSGAGKVKVNISVDTERGEATGLGGVGGLSV